MSKERRSGDCQEHLLSGVFILEATCTSNTANTDIAEAASTPAHDSKVNLELGLGDLDYVYCEERKGM